ncbi:ORFL195W, partial [Human betaherpesvirus 5]
TSSERVYSFGESGRRWWVCPLLWRRLPQSPSPSCSLL